MRLMQDVGVEQLENLRKCAEEARRANYAPYSSFVVLAAVEAVDGQLYAGSNVEIVNYSLSKHAEEVAILSAISGGQDPATPWLKTLYVAGAAPCGSCRQFALEFAAAEAICVVDKLDQKTLADPGRPAVDVPPDVSRLADLLPKAFGPAELGGAGGSPPPL